MTPYAVALVLASSIVHVAWNTAGKRENPSASFLLVANTLGGLCLVPLLFWVCGGWPQLGLRLSLVLIATGACQALYYAGLAGAYRSGDLSIAYPIARSVPPVLVLLGSVALGRGEQISLQCGAGIALIFAGGLLLPMRHFADLRWSNYLNRSSALALLAAVGTTGYSLLDDRGVRLMARGASLTPESAAIAYSAFEAASASAWLAVWVGLGGRERAGLGHVLRERKRSAFLTGLGIYTAYTLVLAAMAFADDVSYVVGLRQLSVPLGALVGIRFLREDASPPKFAGVALVFAGLVAVATG